MSKKVISSPDFYDIAILLSQAAVPMILRYDPYRSKNNYTIISPEGRVCDTDEPLVAMRDYLVKYMSNKAK